MVMSRGLGDVYKRQHTHTHTHTLTHTENPCTFLTAEKAAKERWPMAGERADAGWGTIGLTVFKGWRGAFPVKYIISSPMAYSNCGYCPCCSETPVAL